MAPDVPRYAPALPLPARAFRPGRGMARPGPPAAAGARARHALPDAGSLRREDVECFRHGVDLYNSGYWWEAHEAWEALWQRTPRGSGLNHLLRGLIMLAAAHLKHAAGQPAGRQRLLARAADNLRAARAHPASRSADEACPGAALGLAVEGLIAAVDAWREAGGRDRAAGPPPLLEVLRLGAHSTAR